MSMEQINFPVTFVVLDLEWNQPIPNMPTLVPAKELPGEIIEIGAVKLTMKSPNDYSLSAPFSIVVKPEYYKIMNRQVSRVINRSTDDLRHGLGFLQAYDMFLDWCGEDYVLCAWGDSDISILKSNLKIHLRSAEVNDRFLDVQPLFGRVAEDTAHQRSVSYAVDFYRIPRTDDFHNADRDAYYEACILKEVLIDYFVLSQKTAQEGKSDFPHLSQYISNPNLTTQVHWKSNTFPTEKQAIEDALKVKLSCPICSFELDPILEWFASGHTWLSLWKCETHNTLSGKIRAKKTPQQLFYASGQLRFVNGNAARHVQEKWQEKLDSEKESRELTEKTHEM